MDKKTFNINTVINSPSSGACLEEVLASTLESVTLDSQDVIDIITVVSKQHHQFQKYFGPQQQTYPHLAARFPDQPIGGFGMAGRDMGSYYGGYGRHPHLNAYEGKDHPEFFEQLFALVEFQISYRNTFLTDSFKFVGVEGEHLTFLGRDKELAKIVGGVVLHQDRLEVNLDCARPNGMFRVYPTPASGQILREAIQQGALPLPGMTVASPATRELMAHLRNHGWHDLIEGELVVRVDDPEQVYLMGLRVQESSEYPRVMVIPVEITESIDGLVATPSPTNIHTLDLMLLKRYKHKG